MPRRLPPRPPSAGGPTASGCAIYNGQVVTPVDAGGSARAPEPASAKHVLLIDDDLDLAPLVQGILTEEGWRVSVLSDTAAESVRAAVDRLEPDCIMLDGAGQGDFGASWLAAAAISQRPRPIPVIMFSVDARATGEAQAGTSARTRRADFAAVLPKPFELDALLNTVAAVLAGSDATRSTAP